MTNTNKKYSAYSIGRGVKNKYFEEIYNCVFKNVDYKSAAVKTDDFFDDFIERKEFDFLNVLTPFQTRITDYLDRESELARKTNFCNFILNKNGILSGFNTEVYGIKMLFKQHGIDLKNKKILVIAKGNSENSLLYVLKDTANDVVMADVSREGLEYPFTSERKDFDLIISTIPTDSKLCGSVLIDLSMYKNLKTYIDFAYAPYRTPTMIFAKTLGIGSIGGMTKFTNELSMSILIMNKTLLPSSIWSILKEDIVSRHTNIYLIGLPTNESGKLGEELKALLEEKNGKGTKSYIDTDELIQKSTKKRLKTILSTKEGQKFYLSMQNDISKELAKVEGRIVRVPCALLSDVRNYELIAPKGFFVYLKKTDFDKFTLNKKSCISSVDELKKMYRKYNGTLEEISDLTTFEVESPQKFINEACDALQNS